MELFLSKTGKNSLGCLLVFWCFLCGGGCFFGGVFLGCFLVFFGVFVLGGGVFFCFFGGNVWIRP